MLPAPPAAASKKNMKQPDSPSGEILHLAWPMFIAQMAVMATGAIDTAMAGRLSAIDLAAVGIGATIQVTVLMSLMGVLLAMPPLIAHLHGAGQSSQIGAETHQSAWVALALALLAILLLRNPEPFIAISDLQPAVEAKVRRYLDASSWGVPAALAFRLFYGLCSGIGRPRPVMMLNLLALALKVPLNAVFMFGLLGAPALGGPGCAVATAISAWAVAALAWGWLLTRPEHGEFRIGRRLAAPDPVAIQAILRLGLPIGMTFVADITAFTFMALFIARLGPTMSAAHQIAANVAALAFMLPFALGNATAVLVGQSLGAGQDGRARRTCWNGLGLGMSIAVALSLTLWLGAPQIVLLYTSDAQVQAAAAPLIALVALYHLADALQAVSVNALRGYRRSTVPMLIYVIALWGLGLGGGVVLGLSDLLGPPRGAAGFWLAAIASLGLAGSLVTLYLDRVSRSK
jgi:MATE family multidrug resistance protein